MKNISILFLLVTLAASNSWGQNDALLNTTWKVEKYNATFRSENIHLFHKDSVHNEFDYSKTEFEFSNDGTYQVKDGDDSLIGAWAINSKGDSLILDNNPQQLVQLNAEKLITRRYTLQFADLEANLDTVFYYMEFAPATEDPLGFEEVANQTIFLVYPNPTSGLVKIELGAEAGSKVMQIQLLNISGQTIRKEAFTKSRQIITLDLQGQPSGTYIIKLLNAEGKTIGVKRIVKKK